MPTLNSIKHTFGKINMRYSQDSYDVFTEGIRLLIGEVPEKFYIKCSKCKKRIKLSKALFGPADFCAMCFCGNFLVTCLKSDKNSFYISL